MTDETTKETQAGLETAQATSPLDELRAEFAKDIEQSRLFKRFPARSGRLAAEYAPVHKKAAVQAVEKGSDTVLLASALKRILIHDPSHTNADAGGLVPLGMWSGQSDLEPLGFDHRLADLLGIPRGDASQIVLALFEGNDLALAAQAAEVGRWSTDTKDQSYQDFAGGS